MVGGKCVEKVNSFVLNVRFFKSVWIKISLQIVSKCQSVKKLEIKKKFNVLNIKSDLTCKDACMNGVTCIASTCPDAAIQLSHTDRHTLSHNSYTRSESDRPETIIVPFFF